MESTLLWCLAVEGLVVITLVMKCMKIINSHHIVVVIKIIVIVIVN